MSTFRVTGAGVFPESLSIHEFNEELRRGLTADMIAAIDKPLGTAVAQIEAHPNHLQSLLLARILSALTFGVGSFRRPELFALDRPTRALAVALENARTADSVPVDTWKSAVDAAGVAQLGTPSAQPAVNPDSADVKA